MQTTANVSAESGAVDDWLKAPPVVLSQTPQFGLYHGYVCDGNRATIYIEGNGTFNDTCVFGDSSGVRLARFLNNSSYMYAIAFSGERSFHEVRGICGYPRCIYSPSTDTLVMHTGIQPSGMGAAVYEHFTSRLELRFDPLKNASYFQFQSGDSPEYQVKAGNKYLPVEAMAMSANGRWAAIELKGYGMMRLDMTNFEARRVSAPGATYGLGHDPTFELAISNDGNDMAITGRNASVKVISIDNDCGDSLVDGMDYNFSASITPCRSASIDYSTMFSSFDFAGLPRFDSSGKMLGVSVHHKDGGIDRVIIGTSSLSGLPQLGYLALGDSFTSGEGELDDSYYRERSNVDPFKCHVSIRSYPYLVGQAWGVSHQSVACSGAKTVDILGGDSYAGQANALLKLDASIRGEVKDSALNHFDSGIIAQLDFVSIYQPRLVSIGIGGNDAGLVGKLMSCLNINTCEWASDPIKKLATSKEIQAVYPKLVDVIRRVKEVSPMSRILLVGYPNIINATASADCGGLVGSLLNPSERVFITETIHYLNMVVKAAADTQNVDYADIEGALASHELCGSVDSDAMNDIRFGDDIAPIKILPIFKVFGTESFHPTPYGHQLEASQILDEFPNAVSTEQCDLCADSVMAPTPPSFWSTDLSSGAPVPRQQEDTLIAQGTVNPGGSISINTDNVATRYFQPGTTVSVEIHTDEALTLTSVVAGSDGSINLTVDLPSDLSTGYSVLHLVGTSMAGDAVDIYKTIAVEDVSDTKDTETGNANADTDIKVDTEHGGNAIIDATNGSVGVDSQHNTLTDMHDRGLTGIIGNQAVLGVSSKTDALTDIDTSSKPNTEDFGTIVAITVVIVIVTTLGIGLIVTMYYLKRKVKS